MSQKLGIADIVSLVSESTELPKTTVKTVVSQFLDTIVKETAQGNKVTFVGFGTFEKVFRKERQGKNPSTGQAMVIKAAHAPKFKAGSDFKSALN